jgi:hypothetical protein
MGFRKLALLAAVCTSVALAPASPAAAITIGQLWPGSGSFSYCGDNYDYAPGPVSSGAPYVVPSGFSTITSWSTNATANTTGSQLLTLKVFRSIGGNSFMVVAHDGPRVLAPSTLNTFAVNIAVQPGDLIGLHAPSMNGGPACNYLAGPDVLFYLPGSDIADGASGGPFYTDFGHLNLSAEVAPSNTPSNAFTYFVKGKNLEVIVSAAGRVDVSGAASVKSAVAAKKKKKLKPSLRPSSASGGPGTIEVPLDLTKLAKKKLKRKGRVTLGAKITFTPQGGLANTQMAKLKIKTKRK